MPTSEPRQSHLHRLPRAAPRDRGVDPAGIAAFLADVERSGLGLHSLMVVARGAVVAEGWWAPYAAELPHQLFSLSKSVTATAVGFAEAEGLLCLDDPVLQWCGDRAPSDPSAYLRAMRIEHLLTMTAGHDVDPSDAVFDRQDWVRAFLATPVDHEPGAHFVYNTAATYVLSAIVQRASGQRLVDYLRPRLLDPLGVVGATWQRCPQGVDTGGFGLSMRTEDVACLGQLYLAGGTWDGRQVLPPGWVERATARHVPSGEGEGDWDQGYGYQLWRSRHGYRGDGAFGQFALVLPEQEAVVAMTAGEGDMAAILDRVWTHLRPALDAGQAPGAGLAVAPDPEPVDVDLAARLAGLHVPWPVGAPVTRPLTVRLDENPLGIVTAHVEPHPDGARVRLAGAVAVDLVAGHHAWVRGRTTARLADDTSASAAPGDATADATASVAAAPAAAQAPAAPVALAAAWTSPSTLELRLCWVDGPFALRVVAHLAQDAVPVPVRVDPELTVAFGPTRLAQMTGVAEIGVHLEP
ncbi:serine hydrolase [Actinotalea sp.]|uniref:serine hydrolase n=1 Tax=Actinotalea sp. TaxID=1872145 RepID=UPI002B7C8280|nr:serine hydrolase [Actinotalea sp.]HQY34323.1 serine hydrolase [Actinotalea sp.]HRA51284.1 serine hydrolase [Actinotalea sp.]